METDAAARAFGDDVRGAFARAWASVDDPFERSVVLGGRVVRLRLAGPDLVGRFVGALAHLPVAAPDAPADLVISCWDRRGTGVAPPPPPGSFADFLPRGRIRGFTHSRVRVAFDAAVGMLSVFDPDRGEAYVTVFDASTLARWVERAPMRTVLTWLATDRGLAFLHAGAVGLPEGAVALAGGSGAGKSTTAWTCIAAGFDFLGDDACIVELEPAPRLDSVYRYAKLEPDAFDRVPAARRFVHEVADGQVVMDPGPRLAVGAPLRAVLLPVITGSTTSRTCAVAPAVAWKTLVGGNIHEGDGAGSTTLPVVARLVQRVPCLRLELGTDPEGVVGAVRAVLEAS